MKTKLRYLSIVLTIIALNLTIQTLQSLEIIPKAHATPAYVNTDGSIDVNIQETVPVKVESIDQHAFYYVEPLIVQQDGQISVYCDNCD